MDFGRTREKMHQDYVKMFVLIAIVSRGVRVFANPGRKRGTVRFLGTHKGDKPLNFLGKGIY